MYIQIKNVAKRYGDRTVLQNIDINVERGQFVALLGPSGCGKTTLLNALSGLIDIDDGEIVVDGKTISAKGATVPPEKRQVGMVFQDFALWPHMNVFDNVAFGLKIRKDQKSSIRERVAEVLRVVRMAGFEDRFPHQLSGGQKQRIAIARALAPSPTVLLLDEPLSSLDAKLREEMRWELLSILQQANITSVYVTHDQIEALSMADHIVLLNQGNVEQQGIPTTLYQKPETEFAAWFLGASNRFEGMIKSREGEQATVLCGDLALLAHTTAEIGTHVIAMIRPTDVHLYDTDNEKRLHDDGAFLTATIKQRAFHGVNWHYRLVIDGAHTDFEATSIKHFQAGDRVHVFIPTEACHVVKRSGVLAGVH
nr:ABC transporter ATP-binding protein [Bacilli bacterium]